MAKKVYKALADPSRRKILQLLREKDLSAGEIADHFDFTKPTLSRHLSVLRETDLIQNEKRGNFVIYHLNVSVLEEAIWMLMEEFSVFPKGPNEQE